MGHKFCPKPRLRWPAHTRPLNVRQNLACFSPALSIPLPGCPRKSQRGASIRVVSSLFAMDLESEGRNHRAVLAKQREWVFSTRGSVDERLSGVNSRKGPGLQEDSDEPVTRGGRRGESCGQKVSFRESTRLVTFSNSDIRDASRHILDAYHRLLDILTGASYLHSNVHIGYSNQLRPCSLDPSRCWWPHRPFHSHGSTVGCFATGQCASLGQRATFSASGVR